MSESSEIGSDSTTAANLNDVSNVSNSNTSGVSEDRLVKLAYSKEESYASYSADEDDPNDESAAEDGNVTLILISYTMPILNIV